MPYIALYVQKKGLLSIFLTQILFKTFGNKVKSWITFNEPLTFCREGYGGDDAPGGRSSGLEAYMCGHNVLRAHGKVYRMFEKEFKNKTGGKTHLLYFTLFI